MLSIVRGRAIITLGLMLHYAATKLRLIVALAAVLCATLLQSDYTAAAQRRYELWTVARLKDASRNAENLSHLDGRRIRVTGLVHAYASGSIFLDLRPDAPSQLGTENERPPIHECIGLVVPRYLSKNLKRASTLEIHGDVFLFDGPTSFVSSAVHGGITFYPNCGYFSASYPYIHVTNLRHVKYPTH